MARGIRPRDAPRRTKRARPRWRASMATVIPKRRATTMASTGGQSIRALPGYDPRRVRAADNSSRDFGQHHSASPASSNVYICTLYKQGDQSQHCPNRDATDRRWIGTAVPPGTYRRTVHPLRCKDETFYGRSLMDPFFEPVCRPSSVKAPTVWSPRLSKDRSTASMLGCVWRATGNPPAGGRTSW